MKSKWVAAARAAIIFFMLVLLINCIALFTEIKRDISYDTRATGLSTLNDYFDAGEYQKIYVCAVENNYSDEELYADVSQYEAFGRYYHAYTLARIYDDNEKYLAEMEAEKANITWKKVLAVIDKLEKEL